MVAHSREHTLTRWVEHLNYCIKVHCYYVKVYKISFLKDQGNDRNPIRHWTWTSINHRTREPVGSLPRLSLRSEICMEANTEERSGFNLLLMRLELVDVPVCRNETTTEVVSPWRSEVEVEGCGELDCVKIIISEKSWRPGTGDLRVSRVGIPLPADMSARTTPGWTENARILGLSTIVFSVSGYLLSGTTLFRRTCVNELRDLRHSKFRDSVRRSAGVFFHANHGRDIDDCSGLFFARCRERSDICVCHCVGSEEVGLL